MRPNKVRTVAKERFSYLLRPGFARSAWCDLPAETGAVNLTSVPGGRWRTPEISMQLEVITGSSRRDAPAGTAARPA